MISRDAPKEFVEEFVEEAARKIDQLEGLVGRIFLLVFEDGEVLVATNEPGKAVFAAGSIMLKQMSELGWSELAALEGYVQ